MHDFSEFLKDSYDSAESTIRALDVKAQIGCAVFALSVSGLPGLRIGPFAPDADPRIQAIVALAFLAIVALYLHVIVPIFRPDAPAPPTPERNIYFPSPEDRLSAADRLNLLKTANLDLARCEEIDKAHRIVVHKNRRFARAVVMTFLFYLALGILFAYGPTVQLWPKADTPHEVAPPPTR